MEKLYTKVSDIIFQAKLQVRELIESKFNELERETMSIIMKQCNSSGLHSKEKIDELEKRIVEGQREVSELMDDLKTDRGLAAIILFTGEKKQILEKLIEDLDQEFELNYEF